MLKRLWFFLPVMAFVAFGIGCKESGGGLKQFSTIEIDPARTTVEVDNSYSSEYRITVRNTGNIDLNITDLVLDYTPVTDEETQAGPAFYMRRVDLPVAVKPVGVGDISEQYFTFTVSFKRYEDFKGRSATLTIVNDNTEYADKRNLAVKFNTRQCAPNLNLPAQVDFDHVGFEDSGEEMIALNNTGSCRLDIDWVRLDGKPTFEIEIDGQVIPASEDFQEIRFDPPLSVEPNSGTVWTARFTPVDGEPDKANLVIHSNNTAAVAGLNQVELIANSTGPKLTIDPNPVDFGAKLIGKVAMMDVKLVSSGTADLVMTDIKVETIEAVGSFTIDLSTIPDGPPTAEKPLTLSPGASVTIQATYEPPVEPSALDENDVPIKDRAELIVKDNTFSGETVAPMSGFGVSAECPTPVILIEEGEEVGPVTILHLHGEQSVGANGEIDRYNWTVTQPEDNKFNFVPNVTFENPTHQANVAGEYIYCLDVCDQEKCSWDNDCKSTACKKVVVVPDEAILVELTWRTPGDPDEFDEGPDAGSDLDLHFAHPFAHSQDVDGDGQPDPWFDETYDVFWFNVNPEWETSNPNARDNPKLDRDDTDGAGPETITLGVPMSGRVYRVGVHYWDDHGYGIAYPRVKIWIRGIQVYDRDLEDLGLSLSRCDMWEVATITWPHGTVVEIKDSQGNPKIIPKYQNDKFVGLTGGNCR